MIVGIINTWIVVTWYVCRYSIRWGFQLSWQNILLGPSSRECSLLKNLVVVPQHCLGSASVLCRCFSAGCKATRTLEGQLWSSMGVRSRSLPVVVPRDAQLNNTGLLNPKLCSKRGYISVNCPGNYLKSSRYFTTRNVKWFWCQYGSCWKFIGLESLSLYWTNSLWGKLIFKPGNCT